MGLIINGTQSGGHTNHKWNTGLKGLLRIFLSPPKNVAQDGHKCIGNRHSVPCVADTAKTRTGYREVGPSSDC